MAKLFFYCLKIFRREKWEKKILIAIIVVITIDLNKLLRAAYQQVKIKYNFFFNNNYSF